MTRERETIRAAKAMRKYLDGEEISQEETTRAMRAIVPGVMEILEEVQILRADYDLNQRTVISQGEVITRLTREKQAAVATNDRLVATTDRLKRDVTRFSERTTELRGTILVLTQERDQLKLELKQADEAIREVNERYRKLESLNEAYIGQRDNQAKTIKELSRAQNVDSNRLNAVAVAIADEYPTGKVMTGKRGWQSAMAHVARTFTDGYDKEQS